MTRRLLTVSESDLRELATALRSGRLSAPFTVTALQRYVSGTAADGIASELQDFVSSGFGSGQIATTIELLLEERSQRFVPEELIDLVTSGPEGSSAANRDTSVVVRELFAHANESLIVIGYAVYQGQQVFEALAQRMDEVISLKVRMFLDIQRPASDSSDSAVLVSRLVQHFKTKQGPHCTRFPDVFYDPRSHDPDSAKRTSLHAKCVVVDKKTVFVSSANFTKTGTSKLGCKSRHENGGEVGRSF